MTGARDRRTDCAERARFKGGFRVFTNWRGTVGIVIPTKGSGSLEELIRILPPGIGVIPLFNNIRHGTIGEFTDAMALYEERVAELAEDGVDLIHPSGTPPFMLRGFDGEQKIVRAWQRRYGIPVFTSGMSQTAAMKALGIRKFVGIGYDFEDPGIVAAYFAAAGFEALSLGERFPIPWEQVGTLPSREIYRYIKQLFLHHPGAEGIYIQGSKWHLLDIVETIENDLQVPVVHPVAARCWDIQRRLKVHQPVAGYGRLLAELPAG